MIGLDTLFQKRSLASIRKDFIPIGTGKTGFRSLAPICKEFVPQETPIITPEHKPFIQEMHLKILLSSWGLTVSNRDGSAMRMRCEKV
jgi:hypothetical protein